MTKSNSLPIKWAIIGLGNIAHKFASDLVNLEGAQLYAVASRSKMKAQQFAQQYQAVNYYSSYEELILDEQIDAVYIATPHAFHQQHSEMCLKKGIAVLCEKPFAMNSAEVAAMIACAKQHNTLLMEALWTYFLPHYQFVLEQIKNKRFGEIIKLEADFGFIREFDNSARLFNKSLGGGSLLDIGIYPIFAALTTLGKPNSITADATFFDNGVDASCDMQFNYANDKIAHLTSSLITSTPGEAIFYCEQGIIKINSSFHGPTTVLMSNSDGSDPELIDFDYKTTGYDFEIKHFNALIRQGKVESDIMTFAFSKQLMATIDTVRDLIGLRYQ
ncbi:Gfo/Idh/MocA family protein [Colwelliaceae bacterium BS250]